MRSVFKIPDYSSLFPLSTGSSQTYFPKLEYLDFLQEGIRVEMTSNRKGSQEEAEEEDGEVAEGEDDGVESSPAPTEPSTAPATPAPREQAAKQKKPAAEPPRPLFKGVVFNEMKGALSDPNDLFGRLMQSYVFPTTTYHHNSGGDPQDITQLTHEELLDFHSTFYHPSNSYSLTYGDLPLAPHLQFMNERALNKFTRRADKIEIGDEQRLHKPTKVYVDGPLSSLSDPNKQNKISVAWLTNNITEQFETSCMALTSSLLLNGPNAPLYQTLIASQLGTGYAAGSGYEMSYREATFQVGLNNVDIENIDLVEKKILETLTETAKNGFPKERVDSLIHQLELGQRNVTTGFGIALLQGLTHVWMHGGSPIAALQFGDFLDRLKKEIAADPEFFQKKIQRHLLSNNHRVTLVMLANKSFTEESSRWEKKKLQKIDRKIRAQEYTMSLSELRAQARKLKKRQAAPDDVKVLPKLTLAEIDVKLPEVEVTKSVLAGSSVPVHWIPQPTNGISYFYGKIGLDGLPEHLVPYIPLFCSSLTSVGAGELDYKQFAQQVEGHTGMFRAYYSIVDSPSQLNSFTPHIFFRSSALERNIPKMFELWNTVLQSPRFTDTQRLKTIIGIQRGRIHDALIDSGTSFASTTASSQISPFHRLKESWNGLSQYNLIRQLADKDNLDDVVAKLQEIARFVFQRNRLEVAINGESSTFGLIERSSTGFVEALRGGTGAAPNPAESFWNRPLIVPGSPRPTFLALPIQVNYVADVYRGVPYTSEDFSSLDLATSILAMNFLHKEVREKGGAYGAGLGHNAGALSFYSYRDPNVKQTLATFGKTRDWVTAENITDQQFDDAKLSLFGSLDSPVAPSSKGLSVFKYGLTYEMRQERRNRLMAAEKKSVIEVVRKYLAQDKIHSVAVFGSAAQGEEFSSDPAWNFRTE